MSAPHPRTARTGCDLRVLRAAVFAAACVVLAAAGHGFASCAPVPPWTLGIGFLSVFAVAAPLAGRERSLPGIAVVLAVGQVVLHTLFGLGQHSTATAAKAMSTADAALVARAAHLMCGAGATALSPARAQKILSDARLVPVTDPAAAHHPGDALSAGAWWSVLPSVPMLLGHVLAAVAAGWVLRRGDIALLRLVRLSAHGPAEGALARRLRSSLTLAHALLAGLPGAPDVGPRAPRAFFLPAPKPRTTTLHHTVIRRGPPVTAFVLAA